MAWAYVQSAVSAITTTSVATVVPASPITVGNRLIAVSYMAEGTTQGTIAVSDSAGNTWTQEITINEPTNNTDLYIHSAPITAGGGTTPTVSLTNAGGGNAAFLQVAVLEYSGLSTIVGSGADVSASHAVATASTAPNSGTSGLTAAARVQYPRH